LDLKLDLLSFIEVPIWPVKLCVQTVLTWVAGIRLVAEPDERKITYLGMNLPYGGLLSTLFA
jgi:hypothetical protein